MTLEEKCAGVRGSGNPHAACDETGIGNELREWLLRHSQRKRIENNQDSPAGHR